MDRNADLIAALYADTRKRRGTMSYTEPNSALFALYLIGRTFCVKLSDFEEHFTVGFAYRRFLSQLTEQGFITRTEEGEDESYTLTDLGRRAYDVTWGDNGAKKQVTKQHRVEP